MEQILSPEKFLNIVSRFLALSNDGLIIIDVSKQTLPVVYINEGFCKITGYSQRDVLGESINMLIGIESKIDSAAIIDNILVKKIGGSIDTRLYKKNHSPFDALLSFTPLYSEEKNIEYIFAILEDITDRRKRIEEEASLKTYKQTIEQVNDILFNYMNYLRTVYDDLWLMHKEKNVGKLPNLLADFENEYRNIYNKISKFNEMPSFFEKRLTRGFNLSNN